jgi:hypothetical protein
VLKKNALNGTGSFTRGRRRRRRRIYSYSMILQRDAEGACG